MASNRFIYYITAAFITGNLLLIFIQYNSSKNINALIAGNEKVVNEFKVEAELRDLRKNIVAVESGVASALNSKDTAQIPGLEQAINNIEINLGRLQKIDDNDSSVKYIDQLDAIIHEKIYFNSRALQLLHQQRKNTPDTLINNARGKQLTDSITAVTHKLESSRRQLLTDVTAAVDKSGQRARSWSTILLIMVAASGAALFWFIINRVRQQNQLITQLDASEKRVKEAAKVKENFMANMSHEIRTPLNAILGFTGLLQKKDLGKNLNEHVQAIQKSGENLLTIINDILDFSKFEAGMMRIESVPFSLREMLHSIETMFLQKIKEKNLSLIVTVHKDIPNLLEGDAGRLTQILVNLIGNAVKFTETGGIAVNVEVKNLSDNIVQVYFSIKDTGIGISKKELPNIFDRFTQAETSITRKYGGTGLGLSIVKDLVMLQHGSINVKSEPGAGSEFSFVIPYKKVDASEIINNSSPLNKLVSPVNSHILVVEDNEINQTLMKHMFGNWQLPYSIATSGKNAIEQLQNKKFDLVLMDIQMPDMDGYTVTELIRQQLKLDIPIVAMTAHALAGEKEKCIRHGMNDYISKPIIENALLALVQKYTNTPTEIKESDNTRIANSYRCINLNYMREVSNGNTVYEKTVTAQFIETIPADILALDVAIDKKDYTNIATIAHNMKTTVSVMGLTDILQPLLDGLEYNNNNVNECIEYINKLKQICNDALEDAREFYSSL